MSPLRVLGKCRLCGDAALKPFLLCMIMLYLLNKVPWRVSTVLFVSRCATIVRELNLGTKADAGVQSLSLLSKSRASGPWMSTPWYSISLFDVFHDSSKFEIFDHSSHIKIVFNS